VDPVTLIVTALATGVALALKDRANAEVRDAYGNLKALVRRYLADRPGGELVLERYEQEPTTWQVPLEAELRATGADSSLDLLSAAQALMALADETGSRAGKYDVEVRGAHGVVVGDQNTQSNYFPEPEPDEGSAAPPGLGGDRRGD
jgi:hypothetical protein